MSETAPNTDDLNYMLWAEIQRFRKGEISANDLRVIAVASQTMINVSNLNLKAQAVSPKVRTSSHRLGLARGGE